MIAIAQEIFDRGRLHLFGLILAATYPDAQGRSAETEDPWRVCVREITQAERAQGLPRHLLVASPTSNRADGERTAGKQLPGPGP